MVLLKVKEELALLKSYVQALEEIFLCLFPNKCTSGTLCETSKDSTKYLTGCCLFVKRSAGWHPVSHI
jgi:hypothetical protein